MSFDYKKITEPICQWFRELTIRVLTEVLTKVLVIISLIVIFGIGIPQIPQDEIIKSSPTNSNKLEKLIADLTHPNFKITSLSKHGEKKVTLPNTATQLHFKLTVHLSEPFWLAPISFDEGENVWYINPKIPKKISSGCNYKDNQLVKNKDNSTWELTTFAGFKNNIESGGFLVFIVAKKEFNIKPLDNKTIEAGLKKLKTQLDNQLGPNQWAIDIIRYSPEK